MSFEDFLKAGQKESHFAGLDAYDKIGQGMENAPGDFDFRQAGRDLRGNAYKSNQQMAAQAGGNSLLARNAAYTGGQNTAMAGGMADQLNYQGDMSAVGLEADVLGEQLQGMREQQLGMNRRGIASLGAPLAEQTGDISNEGAANAWAYGQLFGWLSDEKAKQKAYEIGAMDAVNQLSGATQTPYEMSYRPVYPETSSRLSGATQTPREIQFQQQSYQDDGMMDDMDREYLQQLERALARDLGVE